MTNDASPNTTCEIRNSGAALGGSIEVVVDVVVGATVVVVAVVDGVDSGSALPIVVRVGAGSGGSVVWLSPPHDASIRRAIRATRLMVAAYTAAAIAFVWNNRPD